MDDDLRSLADEDLMQLVQRGQAAAFELLYERHSQSAFSLAYRMAGTRGVAEDVVQEAFLNIWRSGARYERARGSVRTWVLGIVHHRAIDALRRSFVHERRRASDEGIELAYFGGFTHTEIATMLETPVGTVKGRMRLGLEKMRHALGSGQVSVRS